MCNGVLLMLATVVNRSAVDLSSRPNHLRPTVPASAFDMSQRRRRAKLHVSVWLLTIDHRLHIASEQLL